MQTKQGVLQSTSNVVNSAIVHYTTVCTVNCWSNSI